MSKVSCENEGPSVCLRYTWGCRGKWTGKAGNSRHWREATRRSFGSLLGATGGRQRGTHMLRSVFWRSDGCKKGKTAGGQDGSRQNLKKLSKFFTMNMHYVCSQEKCYMREKRILPLPSTVHRMKPPAPQEILVFLKGQLPLPSPTWGWDVPAWLWFPETKVDVFWDFPGGPVIKNPPCNTGDVGLIPSLGTKIPHASEQLSLCTTTRESVSLNARSSTA